TLEKVAAALSPRTRLLVISHVSWKSGIVAPVAELAELVHQRDGFLAVDGAQSAGAIPLDMQALGVDFYALPGQKWLCGPEGVGALYVRRDRLSDLQQTYVGYPSMRDGLAHDDSGNFLAASGAARYEVGTVYKPALVGMCAGLDWLASLGWDWIYSRVRAMTESCRARLSNIPGVTVTTGQDFAGLTCFRIDGVEPAQAVTHLADRGVLIRSVSRPDLLRASTSFFNDEADLERLQAGVEELLS
ncbi:MAG: aminotransferase class V-fold PLP-dependent enzyme, partial [Caldilineae bacterium]